MARNAFFPADILIPNEKYIEKWPVIACDQFSSDRDYWERVKQEIGDAPSALKMIVPEAYLSDGDSAERAKAINREMEEYLKGDIFHVLENSFVYVERTVSGGKIRRGLVGKLDLDQYDFSEGSTSSVRASEGTILSRLPARIEVRRGAAIELPHIMALINDEKETVIEPVSGMKDSLTKLYNLELCEGGGHICGYQLSGKEAEAVVSALDALAGLMDAEIVMGDGNHSLAAAKSLWDEVKKTLSPAETENHPLRYALVEINNVYDPAVEFFAIHRTLSGIDSDRFVGTLRETLDDPNGEWTVLWQTPNADGRISVSAASIGELIGKVQSVIDGYLSENGGEVDYIHGDEETRLLGQREGCASVLLPDMDKSDFFATSLSGVFPRKSFSIGHAREKRYYLESRKIK